MSRKELRNDAERMLRFIAADTTTLGADEDEVMLSVHNRGNAIPGEAWNDIFMPLRRGREAGDKSVGLGLCIVRQIARAPGGDVVVNYSGARGPEFSGRLSRSR
jgi:sigma-B regulation protein RsbU (phosphoserine phosphatase)